MSDKQVQRAGDGSLNIQARDISVGLSYSEARQAALDVFESNFIRLSDVARETASQRAQELIDAFLTSLRARADSLLNAAAELRNPDMQYALFVAQREHARAGDSDLRDLLVSLLVDRASIPDRSLLQIVLNESLAVAPRLTLDQMDALSLVFVLRYVRRRNLHSPEHYLEYLDSYIAPFVASITKRDSTYQHLAFAGCAILDISHVEIEKIARDTYPGLFTTGIPRPIFDSLFPQGIPEGVLIGSFHSPGRLQVRAVNEDDIREMGVRMQLAPEVVGRLVQLQKDSVMKESDIRSYILRERPALERLFDVFDNSSMRHMRLTSVGIAIAHANLERRTGRRLDLSIWI